MLPLRPARAVMVPSAAGPPSLRSSAPPPHSQVAQQPPASARCPSAAGGWGGPIRGGPIPDLQIPATVSMAPKRGP